MAEREVIQNFQEGMGLSPYVGFAVFKGIDIWNNPGICETLYELNGLDTSNTNSNLTPDERGIKGALGSTDFMYCHDETDVFKKSGSDLISIGFSTATNGAPKSLYFWKDYLICVSSDGLWAYDDSAETWTDMGTSNFETASNYPIVHFANDNLYIGHGRYVAELEEVAGSDFDPTDTNTFNFTLQALDLPEGYDITTMVAYGNRIYMGTESNGDNTATIYGWDTYSDSFYLPMQINEDDVNYMVVSAGQIYIQAGDMGNWYYTNGSSVAIFKEMPDVFRYDGEDGLLRSRYIVPGAAAVKDDIIYFGFTAFMGYVGNYHISEYSGVWALDTREERLFIAYEFSARDLYPFDGATDHKITDVWFNNGELFVGWYIKDSNGDKYIGVDEDLRNDKYNNDRAYLVSKYYQLGTAWNNYTIKQPELHLAKALEDRDITQNIKVYYRRFPDENWTLHDTLDNIGQSHFVMNDIPDVINIQFKIVLNGDVKLLKMLI